MSTEYKKKLLIISLTITFFYTLHLALPIYILSDYLSAYIDTKYIGVIFGISGLLSIYLINSYNKLLRQYHNYKTTFGLIIADIITLIMMSMINSPIYVSVFTILYISIVALLGVSVNLYVEEFSNNKDTGVVRGIFLTISSLALILGLFIANKLTAQIWDIENYTFIKYNYTYIFLVDALLLLPIIYLVRHYYRHVQEPKYTGGNMWSVLKHLRRNTNLKGVFTANLMVAVFVTTMITYFINYLTRYGHLAMPDYIGILMPIALLPFIIIPYKVGDLADKKYGEKEFMIIGLAIMAISLLAIPLASMYIDNIIHSMSMAFNSNILNINKSITNIGNVLPIGLQDNLNIINAKLHYKMMIIWGAVLILGRIGSSMVETAANSYFYKTISRTDSDSIALFTNIGAIGIVIGGTLSVISYYLDNFINQNIFIKSIFKDLNIHYSLYIIVAIIIIYNIKYINRIEDTK